MIKYNLKLVMSAKVGLSATDIERLDEDLTCADCHKEITHSLPTLHEVRPSEVAGISEHEDPQRPEQIVQAFKERIKLKLVSCEKVK